MALPGTYVINMDRQSSDQNCGHRSNEFMPTKMAAALPSSM